VQDYYCERFGLYEWGSYTGGIWYEPIPEDQVLNQNQAGLIVEAMVRQADGLIIASFPRISKGWSDFDTPASCFSKNFQYNFFFQYIYYSHCTSLWNT